MYDFKIKKQSKLSKARVGEVITPHGVIETPSFIPVATLGVIKGGLLPEEYHSQCQITNTFHFLDLDRQDEVAKGGGLHKFFNFDKPIFTDSGGFQVFSLGKGSEYGLGKVGSIFPQDIERKKGKNLLRITQRGAKFRSPRDGREIILTPELSYEVQKKLGADFIYLLDVCGTPLDSKEQAIKDIDITNQWYERFLKVSDGKQKIFGIIQGGVHKDLRRECTKHVNSLDVFGIAIGGALGNNKKEMYQTISTINKDIDWDRPHHLLGIGDLEVIDKIVKLGIDLFDCALPTRVARHGTAFTKKGYLHIKSAKNRDKFISIEKDCKCPSCKNYTIAQINFLFKAKEQLAGHLLTVHNLWFLEERLKQVRKDIKAGRI
jgi:queuine tRNA-ribosyltransferase